MEVTRGTPHICHKLFLMLNTWCTFPRKAIATATFPAGLPSMKERSFFHARGSRPHTMVPFCSRDAYRTSSGPTRDSGRMKAQAGTGSGKPGRA